MNVTKYMPLWTGLILASLLWVLLLCTLWTPPKTSPNSSQLLPYPDLFRRDGNLTVPETAACAWSESKGLTPCVYRTGKELQTTRSRRLHVTVVACEDRFDEAVVLLKSVVALTTTSGIVFHVFSDIKHHVRFVSQFQSWPAGYVERVEFRLYPDTYPSTAAQWKGQFGPCASLRLLLPSLLRDVDAVAYLDADSLLLSPLDVLWDHFSRFNSSQQMALVAEHETAAHSWYLHNSQVPFYRPYGLNSGVVLMNLTRLRQADWMKEITGYVKSYGPKITFFDQDLYNIYCHLHPDRLYQMKCSMNFRADHCSLPGNACEAAGREGVAVLHGSRRAFHTEPALQAVYQAFRQFKLGDNVESGLLVSLRRTLMKTKNTDCGRNTDIFTKRVPIR